MQQTRSQLVPMLRPVRKCRRQRQRRQRLRTAKPQPLLRQPMQTQPMQPERNDLRQTTLVVKALTPNE
jgi:hypothetical protein